MCSQIKRLQIVSGRENKDAFWWREEEIDEQKLDHQLEEHYIHRPFWGNHFDLSDMSLYKLKRLVLDQEKSLPIRKRKMCGTFLAYFVKHFVKF